MQNHKSINSQEIQINTSPFHNQSSLKLTIKILKLTSKYLNHKMQPLTIMLKYTFLLILTSLIKNTSKIFKSTQTPIAKVSSSNRKEAHITVIKNLHNKHHMFLTENNKNISLVIISKNHIFFSTESKTETQNKINNNFKPQIILELLTITKWPLPSPPAPPIIQP